MQFAKITDLNLNEKRVFIRTDMNVPIVDNKIQDTTRIDASLKTIKYVLDNNGKVIIATHLGRPKEGLCEKNDSITIIANFLENKLNCKIPILKNLSDKISDAKIIMLENVRCNIGEKANDLELGKQYAKLCDVFIHDAFATSHRKESSTDAIANYVDEIAGGLLMIDELNALNKVLINPKKPLLAIVGGSKISTKLSILYNLALKVDYLIVGGGILNTFLQSHGYNVGKSLVENKLVDEAKKISDLMRQRNAIIPLPQSVIVATNLDKDARAIEKSINNIANDEMILDVGNDFIKNISQIINTVNTIIWNGPIGVFEFDQFANGTKDLALLIAKSNAFTLAGGGDTILAINKFGIYDKIGYISTAGGALLEFLEGKKLPGIELLTKAYFKNKDK